MLNLPVACTPFPQERGAVLISVWYPRAAGSYSAPLLTRSSSAAKLAGYDGKVRPTKQTIKKQSQGTCPQPRAGVLERGMVHASWQNTQTSCPC